MKLTAKEDIEAPIDEVFAQLTDFEGFERAGLRRGAHIQRTDLPRISGVGQTWQVGLDYRGKRRVFSLRLQAMDRPNSVHLTGGSKSMEGEMIVDLVPLSRRRTRVSVALEVKAKTLASRIFLQSLRLAKGRVTQGFSGRVKAFMAAIEDRLAKPTLG